MSNRPSRAIFFTVLVASLGYFVDIYDLLLFAIVRTPSLQAIGTPAQDILHVSVHLLNMQMIGMLLGGILWGVIADKRGRKSVLFGSILLYSLCNLANAFVTTVETYSWLRFFSGVGLAGELGAAITLVAEVMPKETRGYGTTIVAGVGLLGAVFASLVGDAFTWKIAYLVGGGMGLGLLALRAGLSDSSMFAKTAAAAEVMRGSFHRLLLKPSTLGRYLCCILIGVPIWFVIGVLITFAPELSREIGVSGAVTGSRAVMWCYAGLSLGDFSSGLVSQWLRSRKKAVLLYLGLTTGLCLVYVYLPPVEARAFYGLCACLGVATGYWAMFVTIAAEQFGTNIRGTVTTTVPNIVRGSVVPLTIAFEFLRTQMAMLNAVLCVGLIALALAFVALYFLRETFGHDLDYHERMDGGLHSP